MHYNQFGRDRPPGNRRQARLTLDLCLSASYCCSCLHHEGNSETEVFGECGGGRIRLVAPTEGTGYPCGSYYCAAFVVMTRRVFGSVLCDSRNRIHTGRSQEHEHS